MALLPKVSIIVPVYNAEQYLRQCIESVLDQTLQDIELILVDDGTPDNSGVICDKYAECDNRVKVIHKENAGMVAARNDGLRTAKGNWVLFADADDFFELTALNELYKRGEESNADIVFGDINVLEGDKSRTVEFYRSEFTTDDQNIIEQLIKADFSCKYCFDPPKSGPGMFYGGPWNKLVRREFLIRNNIAFDKSLKMFEDVLYTAYLFANAEKVSYIHIVAYNYRLLQGSSTKSYKSDLPSINEAIFKAWDLFRAQFDPSGIYQYPFYALVMRRFTTLLGLYFFNKSNPLPLNVQFKELKKLMKTAPYDKAIAEAEINKLHGKRDKLFIRFARIGSPLCIYVAFRALMVVKGGKL